MMHGLYTFGMAVLQVLPVSTQTALVAFRGKRWAVFGIGAWISLVWRFNARNAAHDDWFVYDLIYALGAACASVAGPWLVERFTQK